MNRPPAALVALLLLVAPVAALPGAPESADAGARAPELRQTPAAAEGATLAATPMRERENGSNYLVLDDPVRATGFAETGIDVGATLARDEGRLDARYRSAQLDAALEDAENDSARRVALARAADRLDERVAALERRQQAAIDAYGSGDMSARTFLRELATVAAAADGLSATVDRLSTLEQSTSGVTVSSDRIASLRARLVPLRGPVRTDAAATMAGKAPPTRVFVATSERGVVLSTVDDDAGRYVREASVPVHRAAGAPDQFDGDVIAAFERLSDLYPWLWENKDGVRSDPDKLFTDAGVYGFVVTYRAGATENTLTTYLDGGTGSPFREFQNRDLRLVNYAPAAENTSDGLRLRVNRTYRGGPLDVTVVDNATGAPVDATVYVNGERVGETGADGRRYALTPSGEFNVTAEHRGRSVTVRTIPSPLT